MKKLGNRVKISTATTGTGTITLGAALSDAFYTPAEAGLQDGDVVSYVLTDGSDVEQGFGTIGNTVTTLSRDTVRISKIGGTAGTSKLNLDGGATLFIAPSAEDEMFYETHGTDIASAATLNLETATGAFVHVTGTTAISAVTLNEGHVRWVYFAGALTIEVGTDLVANGGGGNITTAAGDMACFRADADGVVYVTHYPVSGKSVVAPAGTDLTGSTLAGGITASSIISVGTLTSLTVAGQITSEVSNGTAPLVVSSSTVVANLNASFLNGATFASPGSIGATTPSSGAFTTLSASSAVSGTGFTNYMASPPSIGGTAANTGNFTTLTGVTINATTGFQVSGGATSGNVLRGNGANFVSAQLGAADISGLAASATTDATNASNISSGTLNVARLPSALAPTTIAVNGAAIGSYKIATNGPTYQLGADEGVTINAYAGGTMDATLAVQRNSTTTTGDGDLYGIVSDVQLTQADEHLCAIAGTSLISGTASNVLTSQGGTFIARYTGTGQLQSAYGLNGEVDNNGSGTINKGWAVHGVVNINSTATVNQAIALRARQPNSTSGAGPSSGQTATWVSIYGTYIDDQNPANSNDGTNSLSAPPVALYIASQTATGGFGIQQAGSAINELAGSLIVGSGTDPGAGNLLVSGFANVGSLKIAGSALAAANLADGLTGTGSVVMSASPALTGTPTAPTAAAGANSTQIATTAYLDAKLGAVNGIATLDSSGKLTSAQMPPALVGALQYQGVWNASTNSPTLVSSTGTKGQYYKISTAGTTTIDGTSQWNVGDMIVFDGTTWDKIDGVANEVLSVAGRTGVVTLSTSDISGLVASATTDTTNASNISSGTLAAARLPTPTSGALGGIKSNAGTTHKWISAINTDGSVTLSQPAFSDVSGNIATSQMNGGTSASSTTFWRGDGTWASAVTSVGLSMPSILSVGGTPITGSGSFSVSLASQTANFVFAAPNGSAGTPTFRALVGADLPTPTSTTLGGIKSNAGTTHQWVSAIGTTGAVTLSQPAFSDISGTASSAQLPTDVLYSDVTATISKGFKITPNNIGSVTTGTITPDPTLGNYQYLTNNGAFTLAAPTSDCAIELWIFNGSTAGAITFSGYTVNSNIGEPLTTTNTNVFVISIRRVNGTSTYFIKALQ